MAAFTLDTSGPIMRGIKRVVAQFRADPEADVTPQDILYVADLAGQIDATLSEVLVAAKALVADDDIYRKTGRVVPRDASYWANLRAAIAKAEGGK